MSLRARIATIVATSVAAVVILTGFGVQALATATLMRTIDDDLRSLASRIESDPRGLLVITGPRRGQLGGAAGIVQIIDRYGAIQRLRGPLSAQTLDEKLPVDDAVREIVRINATSIRTITVDDVRLRMLVTPLDDHYAVQVARPLNEIDQVTARLRQRTLYASGVGAALAAFAAWFIAGSSIRPVSELTRAVEDVKNDLDVARGVPLGDAHIGRHDEVARLARAFDAMLARLDRSRQVQEQLAADAAHELKTPLTSLRTNIEVLAESAERLNATQRQQLAGDVVNQLDELNTMVDGLVAIARVDATRAQHARIDLTVLVTDVLDAARRRYPDRAYDLTFQSVSSPAVSVNGDARDLTLAVSALIDNAVKYAPVGPITTTLTRSDEETPAASVRVCDLGPGVRSDELGQLFQRFFRSPEARGRPGAGLGLALVDRIARAHAGTTHAEHATPHGLCVTITIPLASETSFA